MDPNRHIESFGPGAATNIQNTARPFNEVQAEVSVETYEQAGFASYEVSLDETPQLLEIITTYESFASGIGQRDPTWGYFAFVTDYASQSQNSLSLAVHNLIGVVNRSLRRFGVAPYYEELLRRFKIAIVQSQEALGGASDDRVREEFRALRHRLGRRGLIVPARNMVCLVFDADTIRMLASLEFPDRIEDDHDAFHESTVKVVDVCFGEGDSDSGDSDYDGDGDENDDEESSYAGVGYCRITSLHRLYMILTMDSNTRAMEDLHPMDHTSTEL